jgi:hypothetical protein
MCKCSEGSMWFGQRYLGKVADLFTPSFNPSSQGRVDIVSRAYSPTQIVNTIRSDFNVGILKISDALE